VAQDSGYPGNLLKQDQLNSPFGGEAENNFGGKAWKFFGGWMRDLADWFLQHSRQDMDVQAPLVQDALVVGDCVGMDLSRSSALGGAWIGKMSSIAAGNAVFLYVAMDNVTAGLRCKAAGHGPIPASVSLLNPALLAGGKTLIAVDSVANRLKVAGVGDDGVGYADPKGNVILFAPGRVVTLV
jgi:hypothetical protein